VEVDHIMAAAALPLLFPAVRVDNCWYGDGSIRQAAPLSPALHLGADHLFVISTTRLPSRAHPPFDEQQPYPPPAQVLGVVLNSMLLDHTELDAMQLRRVTSLLRKIPEEQRPPRLRPAEILVLRPTRDLGALAAQYESKLPKALRYLVRGWGTRELGTADAIATVLFEPTFLSQVMECGRADVDARLDEIRRFFDGMS
jgi:NTE family protein